MNTFLLPLLLLLTFFSSAQVTELSESEYLKLEEEARKEMNGDMDKSFSIAEGIGESSNPIHQSSSAGIKSYLYQLEGEEELSDEQYELALQILQKLPDSKEKMRTHMVILNYWGLIQWKREDLTKAYKAFEEGRKLAIRLDDKKQLIKFLNNISRIQINAKNYKSALATLRTSDSLFTENADDYTQEQYARAKSQTAYNLALSYEKYGGERGDLALVDSAIAYYKIAITYSDEQTITYISSQINTTILMAYKGEDESAEKHYFDLLKVCEENELFDYMETIQFNLGLLYLKQERYSEAQSLFEKIVELYEEDESYSLGCIYSIYYMAVIQEEFGDYDKAQEYLDLFLIEVKEISNDRKEEIREFNFTIGRQGLEQDVEALQDRITSHKRLIYVYIGLGALLVVVLLIMLRKNILDKRKARLKLKDFKEKFNKEEEQKKHVYSNTIQNFTMNDQKEKEILIALEKLIDKDYYLSSDFSLQNAAKKIKTNTTYLSHVVNKNYDKSFSEYSNELKVNYVIHQLMENKTYRKYSTQAMAESVGYKSAVSFTRSFKKRTGVTPVQFLKSVES